MSSKFKYNWIPRRRNFEEERKEIENEKVNQFTKNVTNHPLAPNFKAAPTPTKPKTPVVEEKKPQKPKQAVDDEFDDPLNAKSASASVMEDEVTLGLDPLSLLAKQKAAEASTSKAFTPVLNLTGQLNRSSARRRRDFLQWNIKKQGYLKKYSTDKNIPVVSKIVDGDDEKVKVITLDDRLKMRLEQLERDTKPQDMQYMTQQEYLSHLEKLSVDLKNAWNQNDRVTSLKIVIKCTKMLALNTVPQFYPSMFVLVAQVLDQFGGLVFDRLKEKSAQKDFMTGKLIKLPEKFTAADIPEDAKEVCKNWFFKVASIRELISRVYVEMAIIGCNRFLTDSKEKLVQDFNRLARTIRGIGDPLVSSYARLYLARKGHELIPNERSYLQILFDDTIICVQRQCDQASLEGLLTPAQLSLDAYFELYGPVYEWLLEMLGVNGTEKQFVSMLDKYEKNVKHNILLNYIINAFDSAIVAKYASPLVHFIKGSTDATMPKHQVFLTLGEKLSENPPEENVRLPLLNEIWKEVTQLEDIQEYIKLVEVYIEFVCRSFQLREVNILLGDLRKHLSAIQSFEKIDNDLQHTLLNVLENTKDFIEVFNTEHFLPLFDLLKPSTQLEVSKGMLVAFARRDKLIADPVVVNSLYDLAKTVHDSVNNLSDEKDRLEVSQLLVNFINKIDFGTAFEKQLNFFVECRKGLSGFDEVKEALAMQVLSMVSKTYSFVKGKHTKKTFEFTKACMAFVHITIPSIDDVFKKLYLYTLAGQAALMNNLLPQADVLFKTAIESIADIPNLLVLPNGAAVQTEAPLIEFVQHLASCLISVPGHPEQGPFYLLRGLLNVLQEYTWPKGSDGKIKSFLVFLPALAAFFQEQLPYCYVGVSGNDALYSGDRAYMEDIVTIGNTIVEEILKLMAQFGEDTDVSAQKKQSLAALDLFNAIAFTCEPNPQILQLCYNLFNLAQKKSDTQTFAYSKQTLAFLKLKASQKPSEEAQNLTVAYQQLYSKLAQTEIKAP